MASIQDERGFNQGFELVESTRVRMRRRTDKILSCTRRSADEDILEIGCGTGEVAFWMAGDTPARVLATDLSPKFITAAQQQYKRPNLEYAVLDFNRQADFNGRLFDYIVGNGILHHLYNHLDEALLQIKRLLKPGGKLIFWEPNLYNPYIWLIFSFAPLRKKAHLEPDEMAFSSLFIQKKLQAAGYQDIQVEFRDFLLPGIPESLIKPSIVIGDVAEKIPLVRCMSQSLFITAVSAAPTPQHV